MKMRAPTCAPRAAATVSFVKGSVSVRTVTKPATTATRSMRINARPTASLQAAGTVSYADLSEGSAGFERCDDANEDDAGACRNDCQLAAVTVCGVWICNRAKTAQKPVMTATSLRRIGALPRVFAPIAETDLSDRAKAATMGTTTLQTAVTAVRRSRVVMAYSMRGKRVMMGT